MTVPMTCPHRGRPGDPCPECSEPTEPSVLVERTHCATARKRKAAKPHRCESCLQMIPKGEHYVLHTGFPGHDALSDLAAPMRMAECWRCACRYGRDYLLGRDLPPDAEWLSSQVSGLRQRIDAVLAWVAETGCTCPGDYHYGSLPDHELDCPAQVEHLLTVAASASSQEVRDA